MSSDCLDRTSLSPVCLQSWTCPWTEAALEAWTGLRSASLLMTGLQNKPIINNKMLIQSPQFWGRGGELEGLPNWRRPLQVSNAQSNCWGHQPQWGGRGGGGGMKKPLGTISALSYSPPTPDMPPFHYMPLLDFRPVATFQFSSASQNRRTLSRLRLIPLNISPSILNQSLKARFSTSARSKKVHFSQSYS